MILEVRSDYYQVLGFFQAYDKPMYNAVRFTKDIKLIMLITLFQG